MAENRQVGLVILMRRLTNTPPRIAPMCSSVNQGALLVASKKSGIKCLGDLKGKRLALKSLAGGSAVFYLGFAKKLYGIDLRRDVKVYETENPAGALISWCPYKWFGRRLYRLGAWL